NERRRLLGWNAACATVDHIALGVDGAEVAPRRHLARVKRQPDAERFHYAALDGVLLGIVAEEREVSWTAARRHTRRDGISEAEHAFGRERAEVRQVRRLEFRLAVLRMLQPTETVY